MALQFTRMATYKSKDMSYGLLCLLLKIVIDNKCDSRCSQKKKSAKFDHKREYNILS